MRQFFKALTITGVLVAMTRCCPLARAAEPCHDEGPNVVCTKEGFRVLVDQLVEFDRQAQLCGVDLRQCKADRDDLQRRLDDVLAIPQPPPPRPPRALAPMAGYALGLVGLVAAGLMPVLPLMPDGWRVAGGALGAAAVGVGALLVVPLP